MPVSADEMSGIFTRLGLPHRRSVVESTGGTDEEDPVERRLVGTVALGEGVGERLVDGDPGQSREHGDGQEPGEA